MIHNIRLQHFRSYQDESFEFGEGVNIIVGPNASGKTNLLEALMLNCVGRSYRAVKESGLIYHDKEWARLDCQGAEIERVLKIIKQPASETTKKEFVLQGLVCKRLSLQKTIPVVLFEPNHLLLLSGSPDRRREYLDDIITQLVAGFGTLRRQYKRTLAQRNALLKNNTGNGTDLFAWNIRLSQLGGQIVTQRLLVVQEMNQRLSELYSQLAHSASQVSIFYETPCSIQQYSSDLLHKLETHQAQDIQRGFTSFGPHREDFSLQLNNKIMQHTASRGETRTLLLALKIIELELIENQRGQRPLLLLDDVFSELDGARRRALTEVLQTHQTFITTTDADIVVQHFMGNCNIIALS